MNINREIDCRKIYLDQQKKSGELLFQATQYLKDYMSARL